MSSESKKMTNNDLEEQGLVECCAHCNSLNILQMGEDLFCKSCGTVNFTEIITEAEYEERNRVKI